MVITLPALPRNTQYNMRIVPAGAGMLSPTFGGPDTPLDRMGDKWALDVSVPSIRWAGCGMALAADLVRGRRVLLGLTIPEPGVTQTGFGTPKIMGGGQSGSAIDVDGLDGGAVVPKGKFIEIQTGGYSYVHMVTAEATADGSGEIEGLEIWPMLRASPADNAAVVMAYPRIWGFREEPGIDFSLRRIGSAGTQFTLRERK